MQEEQGKTRFPDLLLPMSVFVALLGEHATDAIAVSIFAKCWYAESLVMREAPKELGLAAEEPSTAQSGRSRDVIGGEAPETFACDFERAGDILDLSQG